MKCFWSLWTAFLRLVSDGKSTKYHIRKAIDRIIIQIYKSKNCTLKRVTRDNRFKHAHRQRRKDEEGESSLTKRNQHFLANNINPVPLFSTQCRRTPNLTRWSWTFTTSALLYLYRPPWSILSWRQYIF